MLKFVYSAGNLLFEQSKQNENYSLVWFSKTIFNYFKTSKSNLATINMLESVFEFEAGFSNLPTTLNIYYFP